MSRPTRRSALSGASADTAAKQVRSDPTGIEHAFAAHVHEQAGIARALADTTASILARWSIGDDTWPHDAVGIAAAARIAEAAYQRAALVERELAQ